MKQVVFTENAPVPIGPYTQAIIAGNTLYAAKIGRASCRERV